jgi:hypothetical protein
MRSWMSATSSLASVVITAKERIRSPEIGSFQFSQRPPIPKGLLGTVAYDLDNLANKLSPDRETSRKGMLQVLQRGPNLIYFRRSVSQRVRKAVPRGPSWKYRRWLPAG